MSNKQATEEYEYEEEQEEEQTPPPSPKKTRKSKAKQFDKATDSKLVPEAKVEKPKRKCSAKQLAALAAGRAKNAELRAKRKSVQPKSD